MHTRDCILHCYWGICILTEVLCCTVEFATLTLDASKQPKAKIYNPTEIDALLQKHGLGKKEEGEAAAPAPGDLTL